ncbi:ArsR/SmtB family transcription factor [Cellulomonas septica]
MPVSETGTGALRAAMARERAEDISRLLRVVSEPTRLQLLSLIFQAPDGRARVVDLTAALRLRQPTISHHLKLMDEAGIVAREPIGREVWYSIVPGRLEAIGDLLR